MPSPTPTFSEWLQACNRIRNASGRRPMSIKDAWAKWMAIKAAA